jgi:hypothetical protein
MKRVLITAALMSTFLTNFDCTSFGLQSESPVDIHYSSSDCISFKVKALAREWRS